MYKYLKTKAPRELFKDLGNLDLSIIGLLVSFGYFFFRVCMGKHIGPTDV